VSDPADDRTIRSFHPGRSPLGAVAGGLRATVAVVILAGLAITTYVLKDPLLGFLSPPPPPDMAILNQAIDSAYARIGPETVSASVVDLRNRQVTQDRIVIARGNSVIRANLEITRAVEKAGGTILYGIESVDQPRRWRTVTLGISNGDSLFKEIRLVGRVR
jgi:hypothetical protein